MTLISNTELWTVNLDHTQPLKTKDINIGDTVLCTMKPLLKNPFLGIIENMYTNSVQVLITETCNVFINKCESDKSLSIDLANRIVVPLRQLYTPQREQLTIEAYNEKDLQYKNDISNAYAEIKAINLTNDAMTQQIDNNTQIVQQLTIVSKQTTLDKKRLINEYETARKWRKTSIQALRDIQIDISKKDDELEKIEKNIKEINALRKHHRNNIASGQIRIVTLKQTIEDLENTLKIIESNKSKVFA